MLELFVYGSLKRGEQNFERYCGGYADVEPARIAGQLYRQASGYPMLRIPAGRAQSIGSADAREDVRRLGELQTAASPSEVEPPSDDWEWIEGELFRFEDNLNERMRRLDWLEDFQPESRDNSLYHRVIAAARTEKNDRWVWTYVAPHGQLPAGAVRMQPSWP